MKNRLAFIRALVYPRLTTSLILRAIARARFQRSSESSPISWLPRVVGGTDDDFPPFSPRGTKGKSQASLLPTLEYDTIYRLPVLQYVVLPIYPRETIL